LPAPFFPITHQRSPRRNRHLQPVVDDATAIGLGHTIDDGDLIPRPRRLAEVEVHHLPSLRQLDLLDLFQRLDAALHLRGLRGVGGKPLDEPLLLGEHRLLARVGRLAIGLADRALALVEIVVAGVDRDLAAVDLGDLATTRFMNSRSCDVISSAPGRDLRNASSQMIDSISRWLVGSSISRTSGAPSSTRAIATRIFQPPERRPTSPSMRSSSKPRPWSTSRACDSSP
jgi:hypothetical protein